jgi:tetratricopeptide (TPR) repeat protein
MAYRVPTFAMLKASYLLGGSIAYGYCVARGIAALGGGWKQTAVALVLTACALSVIAATPGWLYPRGGENERMAGVHAYFGDHDRAEAIYRGRIPEVERPERRTLMRDYLASLLIEAGEPLAAREIFDKRRRVFGAPHHLPSVTSPWWLNRRAVATALAGDLPAARDLLDRALEFADAPESPLLVNRAAVRALLGDDAGALEDLERALAGEPDLAAARNVLAFVRERRGDTEQARRSRQEAMRLAWLPSRGFPYGVGNGFDLNGQRFMLVIEDATLALYRPARSRATQ